MSGLFFNEVVIMRTFLKTVFLNLGVHFFAFILGFAITIIASQNSDAKDLTHRLGLGFKNNTSQSVASLAAVYYPSKDYAFTGGLGFDTKMNYSQLQAHVGFRKMIYFETNLNFYVGAQWGILNSENPADGKNAGFEILGVFGSEFFFYGLDNLGFTLEAGLGATTVKNTSLRTVADDPLRAGIVFYF